MSEHTSGPLYRCSTLTSGFIGIGGVRHAFRIGLPQVQNQQKREAASPDASAMPSLAVLSQESDLGAAIHFPSDETGAQKRTRGIGRGERQASGPS